MSRPTGEVASTRTILRRLPVALVLVVWFLVDIGRVRPFVEQPEALFLDAHVYLRAAAAWLGDGNPWAAEFGGWLFAGPPLTLLPYAPLTLMPEPMAVVLLGVLGLLAVVATILALDYPFYWLLFPPFVEAVLVANPDAFVVLFLGLSPRLVAAIAPILKVYAAVPLLALRQWRPLLVAAVLILLTLPILPWADFLAHYGEITAVLAEQSLTHISAWGVWPLVVIVVIALVALGRRRAGYLAVPALWPHAQLHYATIAVPEARPALIALAYAVPIPYAAPIGLIAYAVTLRLQHRWPALRVLHRPV